MSSTATVPATPPPVFGRTEAARALGVSPSYVQKLRDSGIANPSVPVGSSGRLVYSLADLRHLAAASGRNLDHDPRRDGDGAA